MPKGRSGQFGRWHITNHAVSRFRARVTECKKLETRLNIQRAIRASLKEVPEEDIIHYGNSIAYPTMICYKGIKYGPYYCIAKKPSPQVIVTILSENEWHPEYKTIDDIAG